jgi:hypothetical protein
MYQQLWGYKVEEKLYLGVREQKKVEYHCTKASSRAELCDHEPRLVGCGVTSSVRRNQEIQSGSRPVVMIYIRGSQTFQLAYHRISLTH